MLKKKTATTTKKTKCTALLMMSNKYIDANNASKNNKQNKNIATNHHHHHLSLNREGCWGTTDYFTPSFLHFSLFSTARWDLANSRLVHSLMLSSHSSFVCLVFFSLSLCLARWFRPDLMNGRHHHTTAVCVSLQWPGSLRVVRLAAGSWHGRPRW